MPLSFCTQRSINGLMPSDPRYGETVRASIGLSAWRYASAYASQVLPMSLRFPSAMTIKSLSFAYTQTSQKTFIPSQPSTSKYAICGLMQHAVSLTTSMIPLQNSCTPSGVLSIPSGSFSMFGSSPTQTGDLAFVAAVMASAKCIS